MGSAARLPIEDDQSFAVALEGALMNDAALVVPFRNDDLHNA